MLLASGISEIGIGRNVNQDSMICEPARGLFAAIDGVSGCSDGMLASEILRSTLLRYCEGEPDRDKLVAAFMTAHRKMLAKIDGHRYIRPAVFIAVLGGQLLLGCR